MLMNIRVLLTQQKMCQFIMNECLQLVKVQNWFKWGET